MDDLERENRNENAVGCFYRLKHAILGTGMVLAGIIIAAWLYSGETSDGRSPGPWPWVAAVAFWIVGPLLLWQAFRRR